jgi:hypothetical protein
MKKLTILAAVAMLTASSFGCHHCGRRGAACAPAPAVCDPCAAGGAPVYGGAPTPVYGGETYVSPGPGVVPGPIVQ